MAEVLRLPRMSDTMEEGVIAEVNIKVGDKLSAGDVIAEVETDKATMEWESFQDGLVIHVTAKKGDAIPVDGMFAILGKKGEDIAAILEAEKNKAAVAAPESSENEQAAVSVTAQTEPVMVSKSSQPASLPADPLEMPALGGNGRIKASPLAKRMAKENGVDISAVQGTGDDGRIVKKDIESYMKTGGSTAAIPQMPSVAGEESFTEERVSQMRKTIAKRLSASKFGAPHFYLTMEINMDKTIESRKGINEVAPVKISFNDMIIKAVASALRAHPKVNSSWLEDKIRYNNHINIGMAVAVSDGLLVPVIRYADAKSLSHISTESKILAEKARDKKLQPDEMQGNTFTISNLGMFGIEEFTAIINPPDSCILAIGGIKQIPVLKDGALMNTNVMKVTLSCDHRVVDGVTGSQFLLTLKSNLEDPVRMLI